MAKGNKRNDVDDENSIQNIGDESEFEKSISVDDDTADDSNVYDVPFSFVLNADFYYGCSTDSVNCSTG